MDQEENAHYQKHQADALTQLDTLHKRAVNVLLRCKTVFPFDLFPNTLIIDFNKVDIIYSNFFGSSQTVSIPIQRLNHISVDSVLFLSTLRIEVKGMDKNPPPLHSLMSKDAHLAKNIILGLMSASANGIDLSHLQSREAIEKLIEIGQSV
ncbi:MAG: hypothetical protein AAB462_00170 [Patescibacteria group bacterium]